MKKLLKLLFFIFLLSACTGGLANKKIGLKSNDSDIWWLRTSLYAGSFYDHPTLRMIDNRPFKYIKDVKTPDGYVISPKKQDDIIPIGTAVKLLSIDAPSFINKIKRPLYSPKNAYWACFLVGSERGQTAIFKSQKHCMVLPSYIETEQEAFSFLKIFVAKEDSNLWFISQRLHIQKGILLKKAVLGMSYEHLFSALGPPISKNSLSDKELWTYDDQVIVLQDGEVVKIRKI